MNMDEADEAITAAAAAFALVVEQTQSAIAQARSVPSPATLALEAKCTSLESTIRRLNKVIETHKGELRAAGHNFSALETLFFSNTSSWNWPRGSLRLTWTPSVADAPALTPGRQKLAAHKDAALKNLKRIVIRVFLEAQPLHKRQHRDPESESMKPSADNSKTTADNLKTSPDNPMPPPQAASTPVDDIPKRHVFMAPWKDSQSSLDTKIEYRPWVDYSQYAKSSNVIY
ncbi:hypothetical protein C8F04DRAFT_1363585 [Mycena alexandri]|uniref:Uncharacterized protein n=1 Tax=Mycena alexandri TaxID=1745969 RepID=A0AAD6WLQ1_9AGAR|nr:hypothetical protein C8F04DRAFT_1363585 [Mycena alexandri]